MKRDRGFSLLELLIVVAIILIIATIAIPSLLRSRQAANESAAVATIRTINTAQVTYLSSSGGVYGDFVNLYSLGLMDGRWSSSTNTVSGYVFDITPGTGSGSYTILASPSGTSGRCSFASSEAGVVTYSTAITGCPGTAGNPVQ